MKWRQYRIVEPAERTCVQAQVRYLLWPFGWFEVATYSTLYMADKKKATQWCKDAIDVHSGRKSPEPEFTVIEADYNGKDDGKR